MTTTEKSPKEKVEKFDFSKIDFDVLRERELEEARRRREEMERIRREEEEAAQEPPPVTYSEEEYQKAEQAAFEKGKQEGLKQATIEQNQQILELVKNMAPNLQMLIDNEVKRKVSMEKEMVHMTIHIAKKMMPSLLSAKAAEELEAFILTNMNKVEAKDVIKITVHEELKDVITQRLNIMFDEKSYQDAVRIEGSKDITIDGCRIEWGINSGIERDTGLVLERIENITQSFLSGDLGDLPPVTEQEEVQQPVQNDDATSMIDSTEMETAEEISQEAPAGEMIENMDAGVEEDVPEDAVMEPKPKRIETQEDIESAEEESDLTSQETKDE